MAKKNTATGNSGLSANLLPKFYQTPSNKKFLQATIDQLFQPGSVKKTSGFVGRQNAKAATRDDLYIAGADTTRTNYQLEPSLTIKDKFGNVTFYKDYIDYINQIGVFGGNTKNHSRLNEQEFYSWDPHIDWDKFVNFQNYYWMPFGPELISIAGQGQNIASTYTVDLKLEGSSNVYVFTPNGLTVNPILKLYRGHTYTFEISSQGNPFSLKTERTTGTINRYEVDGVDQGIENGSMTITIPLDAPNTLFYQSETDINVGGVINVYDVSESTFLDVEHDVLGKKNYVLSNGTALSNGMLVEFIGKVSPAMYETGNYYVEGVGTAIKLVPTSSLEVVTAYTTSEDIQFDDTPFDTGPFDGATGFASEIDYITVNRASVDRNPWSRYNRWVHKDVISASAEYNNNIPALDQNARAVRPIIEFQADLKLFNFGTTAIGDVDLIDTFTTDVFSTIEGAAGYNIDGVDLVSGYKILVVADTDPLVTNKIYQVEKLTIQGNTQLHLVEIATPVANQVTLVRRGVKNQSHAYWYNGSAWIQAQYKANTNQPPLFDLVDDNGISFGDTGTYSGSSFVGTTLFSYKVASSGTVDPKLGFAVTHKNVSNIGDIVFNFALAADTFQFKSDGTVTTHPTNVGYLVSQSYGGETQYVNGWQTCTSKTVQAALRVYDTDQVNDFDLDLFDDVNDLADLIVRVYVNGIRLDKSKWQLTTTVNYKRVILDTDIKATDILTIRAFAKQPINSNGYYEIPVNLQNNPLNDSLTEFTLGEVIDHVNSIVDNSIEFNGIFPGAGNLRDLGNVTNRGTKFVQHSGPLSLGIYHITSENSNIVDAIARSEGDYNNFKRTFVSVAETLGVDASPESMVELIMQRINANKPKTSPYYFSDMVPYGGKVSTNLTVVDYRIKTYPLSNVFTLSKLSNKAVGVYLNGDQLLHGTDYEFDPQGVIVIKAAISNGDTITTYEYDSTDGSFVPATPTKLGLWPKFEPKLYLDTSLVTPRWMIQGHDGSQVVAYGTYGDNGEADYRDALILELEKRIFNNIKVSYDPSVFDIADIIPGYNRQTGYSLSEFNDVLAPNFYKWTSLVGIDFSKPLSYDRSNPFTFNYSLNYSPDGAPVPAYWRGIYRWMLDTDRPHLCPWECLGLTIKPEWWDSTYGPAPYTRENLILWSDLANGILRKPNVPAVKLDKYVRPYLINHIPVDDQGNLVSPLLSGLVSGTVTQSTNNNFVFGDVSPVEAAWRRSSHYPFSILSTAMLLTPAKTFGLALDRSRIARNMSGQLVYSDTKNVVRPIDIVMPSIASSETRVETAGIINYVVDYIMNYIFSNNVDTYNQYKDNLSLLTPQLSYRVGAFTNKDQFKLLLESKTPASSGSVFVPSEDYTLFLNKSSVVKKLTYSGVIITKLSTGFEIKGYSRSAPYFKYYNYVRSGNTLNVGGISATYTMWTQGSRYNVGNIVKYGNGYYSVKSAHVATTFDTALYSHLPSLPTVGGVTVQIRTAWDRTTEVVAPYGITFATAQEVVDFISGYSEWLKDQGFVFDQFNPNLNAVTNWSTSAKEFLFWSTQNWSTGEDKWSEWAAGQALLYGNIVRYNGDYYSAAFNIPADSNEIFVEEHFNKLDGLSNVGSSVISLSPSASAVVFNTNLTVVDDIGNAFNSYEIFKVDGTPIAPSGLNSYREGNTVTYSPSNGDGIYCASFYLVQNEHVVTLNNSTIFNDTIYAPTSGYRQERLKVSGYVTTDWYGGLDIPGFVYDQAVIETWKPWQDYTAGDVVLHQGFYYSANEFIPGAATLDASKWTRSTDKPTAQVIPNWTNLASQFTNFYSLESDSFNAAHQSVAQHLIGYQKRQYLENIIQDDVSEFKFFQGMIREKGTQNALNKLFDPLTNSGEESLTFYEEWAVRVGQYGSTNTFENIEFILDEGRFKNNPQGVVLSNNALKNVSSFIINQSSNDVYVKPVGYTGTPFTENKEFTPLLRTPGYINPNDVFVNIPRLSDVLTQNISDYSDGTLVWCTFANPPRYWDVFRFSNQTMIEIVSVEYDGDILTITAADDIPFTINDYIGLTGVDILAGFYQPATIDGPVLTIAAPNVTGFPSEFTQQADLIISTFISQRVDVIDSLDSVGIVNPGETIWADDDNNGKWAVWEYNPVYTKKELHNVNAQARNEYGRVLAMDALGTMSAVNNVSDEVVTREKVGISVPWAIRQTIAIPFIAHKVLGNDLNIGTKEVSSIAFSADGYWLAVGRKLVNNVSVVSSSSQLKIIDAAGVNSAFTEQGMVSIYKKDVNNVYTLQLSIASPAAEDNEHFGASVAFAGDTLFVGAPGTRNVYQYQYAAGTPVTASYNPVGSEGAVIAVSSTAGVLPGMTVIGTGFTDGQVVLSVNPSAKTITLNGSPSSAPGNTVSFVTVEWKYVTSESVAVSGFGNNLVTSKDLTKLLVKTGAAIYIYSIADSMTLMQTVSGVDAALSGDSNYLVLSSGTNVSVYTLVNNTYVVYQAGLVKHSLQLGGNFGTNVAFMNDSESIVVYNNGNSRSNVLVYDRYNTQWVYAETISTTGTIGSGAGFVAADNQVMFIDSDDSKLFVISKMRNTLSWNVKQRQEPVPDSYKIKQVFLYNKQQGELIKYIDVIDPVQGKIAGIADAEIKIKAFYDPASYTIGGDQVTANPDSFWSTEQVGMLWWDLRTAKFISGYFGDVAYRTNIWNTLAAGASIDIYEWVETTMLPDAWDSLADTPEGMAMGISGTSIYGNSAYSVRQKYDNISKTFKNTYYFWVKNKGIVPNVIGRKISALDVSKLISNPRGQGHVYMSVTGLDTFSLVNVRQHLKDSDVVLSVEYWVSDAIDKNVHSQWKLISNDTIVDIPTHIEEKWIDSLCGADAEGRTVPDLKQPLKLRYGIENRPRQSMFVNRVEALKEIVERINRTLLVTQVAQNYDISALDAYDPVPSIATGLYDTAVDTDAELRLINTGSFKPATIVPVVASNGAVTGIEITYAGKGYLTAPIIDIIGDGNGAQLRAVINASGQIIGSTVITGGEGYAQDTTTCSVRNLSVLVKMDSGSDNNWSIYSYDTSSAAWSRTLTLSYDVRKYWNYTDWFATGYNQFSAPDYAVSTFAELNSITPKVGELVRIITANSGGWLLLEKYASTDSVDWTQSYNVVGIQDGTIQLDTLLYSFSNTPVGYDAGTYDGGVYDLVAAYELRVILTVLKNNVFVGTLKQSYLDLFLSSIRYAHSEQVYLDWAFKTSFIRATHAVGTLDQPVTYPVDNLANFEDYIAEVKPYRTHIREYISNYTSIDQGQVSITDFDLQPVYDNGSVYAIESYLRNNTVEVANPVIQTYPWKYWLDNVGFTITEVAIIDGGSGYVSQPTVTIEGGGGSGATAIAYVANGKVNRLILVTPGSGYLSAPSIVFTGGLSDAGVAARGVAIIGESVVRSNLIKMKFDRVTQTYFVTDLSETETFPGEKSRLQYPLKWAPDVTIGNTSVTIGGIPVLRDTYRINIVKNTTGGYTRYTGSITFDTVPAISKSIVVTYLKDISLLNAADRVQYFYNPGTNQIGKDLSQLMTGIDYGGVQVTGLGFELTGGWGERPYTAEAWDVYDRDYNDYIVTVGANTHSFTLPYTPLSGVELNVYYIAKYTQTYLSNGSTTGYAYDKTVDAVSITTTRSTTTAGVTTTYASPVNSLSATIVVGDVTGIVPGMGVIGAGFDKTHRVLLVNSGTSSVTFNKAPTTQPTINGVMHFVNNIAGGDILYVASTNGVHVGDIIKVSMGAAFKYNQTVVTQVLDGTSVKMNQIINTSMNNGLTVEFTNMLSANIDYTIVPNTGMIDLVNPIDSGNTIVITGARDAVRLDGVGAAAIMDPIIADGNTTTFTIPGDFTVNDGDTFIIRQSTSDGSIAPQELDYDTSLIGGNDRDLLTYSSATGIDPEEIFVDGDKFVTPTSSPAPDEVVPGQVVDTVAIKVFDRPNIGSANINVANHRADGVTSVFDIQNTPSGPGAIIVKINKNIADVTTDYTVDYTANTIETTVIPTEGTTISIFSIGFSGLNILDVDYFIADGIATEFITHSPWNGGNVTAMIYVDGVPVHPTMFKTDSTYDLANVVGLRFDTAPVDGSLINFIIVAGSSQTFSITKTETVATDGNLTYELANPVGNSLLNETNMIVRVDQTILRGPNSAYFTITRNKLNYTTDPTRIIPNTMSVSDVKVVANGTLLKLGVDYTIDLSGFTVKINRAVNKKYLNTPLVVNVLTSAGYSYDAALGEITFKTAYDSSHTVTVTSSFVHDTLDIKRNTVNVNPTLAITPDTAEYFSYKAISSGRIILDRTVIDDNYVWVTKNGTLLTPSIDYRLKDDRQSIEMKGDLASTDLVEIMTFGSNVLPVGIAYMQFKDMLNRVQYKRLNANKQTRLLKDLWYYDTFIEVEDATQIDRPNILKGRPGVIEVRGERIEYFEVDGNILRKLRRGTLGTGTPARHKSGSVVTEIGSSETIPYADETVVTQRISDGTATISLDYAPASANDIEVFVGGYDTSINWAPNVDYTVGTIVTIGAYTYRVTAYHQSGPTFKAPVTTLTTVDGVRTVVATNVAYTQVCQFFIGNIRLRKSEYPMFNTNIAPYSPEGDVTMPADFTVDGVTNAITLTTPLAVGTHVTVIRRICSEAWDSTINIQEDTNRVSNFLKAEPGAWYTDAQQISTGTESVKWNSTIITFDSDNVTFDNASGTYN